MAEGAVRIRGLEELQRALRKAPKETKKEIRKALRSAAEPVRKDARTRFGEIDTRSAAGFSINLRRDGVRVEQRRRRVTGKRGDYGALQMSRALEPALEAKRGEVVKEFEAAAERIVQIVKEA